MDDDELRGRLRGLHQRLQNIEANGNSSSGGLWFIIVMLLLIMLVHGCK